RFRRGEHVQKYAVQGYKGNMATWNDYGKFVYALKAGRDQLPENIKKTVHDLTDGLKDPYEKVNVLYNFLQKNSRYISVQLGIGGWQPYDATYVATKRYGDCKALVNYMYSLLKEAGIPSNYTLVKSGESNTGILVDFPSQQFNHVILSVPMAKDTIWLECTSQDLPAGYLSGFTSDRQVLVVNENGGTLVSTPRYGFKDNLQLRRISAELRADGVLTADVRTFYQARQEDDVHDMINALARDKVLERLKQRINLPNYDVLKFEYLEDKVAMPSITEKLSITATDYAQVSGKRIFLTPNILSRSEGKLTPEEKRKFDINIKFEYTDEDSVDIKIPEGFIPEALPQNTELKSAFGSYKNSFKVEKDRIRYYRRIEKFSGRFPAADYPKLVEFNNQVYKADRARIVLIKQ
ncbi:MAG: transglutaminase domain-containing protein, partial [Chitinophagaceae bacterium]